MEVTFYCIVYNRIYTLAIYLKYTILGRWFLEHKWFVYKICSLTYLDVEYVWSLNILVLEEHNDPDV